MASGTTNCSIDPVASWLGGDGIKRLLLIDGHAYAYRSFFAIRQLESPDGRQSNALFGFLKALAQLRQRLMPTHMAVVWDGGLDDSRLVDLPSYKTERPPMPESLATQIGVVQEALGILNISSLVKEGVEADDWIAALSELGESQGCSVLIASADKDFMQLVSDNVALIRPNSLLEGIFDRAKVNEKTGVWPEQICDWLSMVGDAVDGIPGVPSVGPKTASNLLQQFGSIDKLMQNLSQVASDKLRSKISENTELLRRNQRIISLKRGDRHGVALGQLTVAGVDSARWSNFCSAWGFRSLLRDFDACSEHEMELSLK